MNWRRADPGSCLICGAPSCSCGGGPDSSPAVIAVEQLPQRDAAARSAVLQADIVQATLPPGQFTTGTYRRSKKRA